jgi:hypothetical protein
MTVRQQSLLSRLKSALHQVLVMNKLMDGGQLNSRDPQTREMRDGPGVSQLSVLSPQFLGDVRRK